MPLPLLGCLQLFYFVFKACPESFLWILDVTLINLECLVWVQAI